jgi:hypothetical protein
MALQDAHSKNQTNIEPTIVTSNWVEASAFESHGIVIGGGLQRRLTTQRAHRRARATPFTENRAAAGYCSKGILFYHFGKVLRRIEFSLKRPERS